MSKTNYPYPLITKYCSYGSIFIGFVYFEVIAKVQFVLMRGLRRLLIILFSSVFGAGLPSEHLNITSGFR